MFKGLLEKILKPKQSKTEDIVGLFANRRRAMRDPVSKAIRRHYYRRSARREKLLPRNLEFRVDPQELLSRIGAENSINRSVSAQHPSTFVTALLGMLFVPFAGQVEHSYTTPMIVSTYHSPLIPEDGTSSSASVSVSDAVKGRVPRYEPEVIVENRLEALATPAVDVGGPTEMSVQIDLPEGGPFEAEMLETSTIPVLDEIAIESLPQFAGIPVSALDYRVAN